MELVMNAIPPPGIVFPGLEEPLLLFLFISISLTKNPQMANSSPIKRMGVRHRDEP